MRYHNLLVILVLLCLCCSAASAGSGMVRPAKYDIIKSKIDAGSTGLVWEIQNPNIYYVNFRINNFSPAQYDYSIKLFSNGHTEIFDEIPVLVSSGSIQLHTRAYPDGTYWINLMQTVKGDEAAQLAYCERTGYPCEISKNLDLIRMDFGTPGKSGDDYQNFIAGAIDRSGQSVKGAAWATR